LPVGTWNGALLKVFRVPPASRVIFALPCGRPAAPALSRCCSELTLPARYAPVVSAFVYCVRSTVGTKSRLANGTATLSQLKWQEWRRYSIIIGAFKQKRAEWDQVGSSSSDNPTQALGLQSRPCERKRRCIANLSMTRRNFAVPEQS